MIKTTNYNYGVLRVCQKKYLSIHLQMKKSELRLQKMVGLMILKLSQRKNNAVKGDIYLAKITRVEPSLQAAFVDYGLNRHGFLPLTEIHPDYFKIPSSDQNSLKKLSSDLQSDEEIDEIAPIDDNNESS